MLVWIVKDAERKLGGIERLLLREMNILMLKDAARRRRETTPVREIRQEQDHV